MNSFAAVLTKIGSGWATLRVIRGPLLVSIFAVLVLSLPDQSREVYRIMADEWAASWSRSDWLAAPVLRVGLTFLFLIIVSFGVWVSTTDIALRNETWGSSAQDSLLKRFFLRLLLLLPPLLIPIGLAIGLYAASADLQALQFPNEILKKVNDPRLDTIVAEANRPVWWLRAGSLLSLGIAFTMIVLDFVATRFGPPAQSRTWMRVSGSRTRMMAVAAIACVVTTLIFVFKIDFPIAVGTVFLFLSFVLVLALITSTLTSTFDRFRLPVLTGLFLVAVVLSISGVNDNHVVEPVKRPDNKAKVHRPISGTWKLFGPRTFDIKDSAFMGWLKARRDLDHYNKKKQPYPVFIVAAAGGGLYAAAHTAAVLSKLQDRCPNFAQHVFAISGVSGGSLGASAFAALVRNSNDIKNGRSQPCTFGPMNDADRVLEKKTRAFLNNDFLSPLVGAMLFSDFLQRFLPIPIPSFDRARVLDESFERAWARAVPEDETNAFKTLFADLWDPNGAAPALLLNTTDVDNGLRVVTTPFRLQNDLTGSHEWESQLVIRTALTNLYFHADWLGKETRYGPLGKILCDLKLSTAVGLSARFPWVLPAATFERTVPFGLEANEEGAQPQPKGCSPDVSRRYNVRLVDGGYFENSGAETASDVIRELSYFVFTKEEVKKCEGYAKAYYDTIENKKKTKVPQSCQDFLGDKKLLEEAGAPWGVKIHLILINVEKLPKSEPWYGGSEALSPLLGLMSTREERGQLANFRATTSNIPCALGFGALRGPTECDPWLVRNLRLDPSYYLLPLGWHISSNTLDFIAFHSGRSQHAGVPVGPKLFKDTADYKEHLKASDAAACAVQLILRGDTLAKLEAKYPNHYTTHPHPCAEEGYQRGHDAIPGPPSPPLRGGGGIR